MKPPKVGQCSKKLIFLLISLFGGGIVAFIYTVQYNITEPDFEASINFTTTFKSAFTLNPDIVIDLADNYFKKAKEQSKGKLLIDTDKCQIPDIEHWVPDIVKLLKNVTERCTGNINLTYVDKQNVMINEEALEKLDDEIQNVTCCYRTVSRIEQTLCNNTHSADNLYQYSSTCFPMALTTEPISGFIMVNCTANRTDGGQVIAYQNFHALAKLSAEDEKRLAPKFKYWKTYRDKNNSSGDDKGLPPNVWLLGIDSTSRINFHRFMNKTKKALEELDAIEMKGYTKIGENTCPNFATVMTSFPLVDAEKVCLPGYWGLQDNTSFLWHHYSRYNYITGHFEDSPKMAIFNYAKAGFLNQPTDIYNRAWMYAAYTELNKNKKTAWEIDCLGYQRSEEVVLKHNLDLIDMLERNHTPYFITTWLTDLTHGNMNFVQTMDALLAKTLTRIFRTGLLDNTVLFLISDHGYRYGDIRVTTSGWFELKLPTLYVRISEKLRQRHPSWLAGLKRNENLPTSPFDVHETLKDILSLSGPITEEASTRTSAQSLFQNIPSRSCEEAQIPAEFCACYPKTQSNLDVSIVQLGAAKILDSINKDLPKNCSRLKIKKVTTAVIANEFQNETHSLTDYSIGFDTKPGDFKFEAMATYNIVRKKITDISKVQRTNKKTKKTDCLSESESKYELFCNCK